MECSKIEYEIAVAWNWQFDIEFINIIKEIAHNNNVSLLEITPQNLNEILENLNNNKIYFKVFLDRASDSDENFKKIFNFIKKEKTYFINSYENVLFASDKATMHLELISKGINSPYTIILPPYNLEPNFSNIDLTPLGEKIIVKPAKGGGGEGVIMNIKNINEIQNARKQFPNDKYLIQSFITPDFIDSKPAWFRVIFCFNEIFTFWWHPQTHIYSEISNEEKVKFNLDKLNDIVSVITNICKLEIFSTEIALSNEKFIVVDYVNDQIDLRLKSQHQDGVPDEIVKKIAEKIIKFAKEFRCN